MLSRGPKHAQDVVDALKKEERAGGRGRRWRGALRRIQAQLLDVEHDSTALELVFPQARCRYIHALWIHHDACRLPADACTASLACTAMAPVLSSTSMRVSV